MNKPALEKYSIDVKEKGIILYDSRAGDYNKDNLHVKDDVEIIPIHGFVPPGVHPYFSYFTIKSLFNDFIRIKKYSYFIKNNLEVKEDIVEKNLTQALSFIEKRSYDMIFVGSDTILELDRISDDSSLSLYWLSPQIKSKKILLAE